MQTFLTKNLIVTDFNLYLYKISQQSLCLLVCLFYHHKIPHCVSCINISEMEERFDPTFGSLSLSQKKMIIVKHTSTAKSQTKYLGRCVLALILFVYFTKDWFVSACGLIKARLV